MTTAAATIDIYRQDTHVASVPVESEWGVDVPVEDLAEFLADPIGYGQYDHTDPMSLDDFSTCRHMHHTYAAPLAG